MPGWMRSRRLARRARQRRCRRAETDAEGKPEDPVRIERELPDDTTTTPHQHPETAPKSKTDDAASIPAKKAVDD